MEFQQTISVPAIAAVVYAIVEWLKTIIKTDAFKKWIPLVAICLGAVLGVVAFYVYPSAIPATTVWMAIIVGMASGASATWAHEATHGKTGGEQE